VALWQRLHLHAHLQRSATLTPVAFIGTDCAFILKHVLLYSQFFKFECHYHVEQRGAKIRGIPSATNRAAEDF